VRKTPPIYAIMCGDGKLHEGEDGIPFILTQHDHAERALCLISAGDENAECEPHSIVEYRRVPCRGGK
jgi:hypothetical protein